MAFEGIYVSRPQDGHAGMSYTAIATMEAGNYKIRCKHREEAWRRWWQMAPPQSRKTEARMRAVYTEARRCAIAARHSQYATPPTFSSVG